MKVFVAVLFCLAVAQARSNGGGKIIGGKPSNQGQFPSLVSLQYPNDNFHFCGGSLISDRYVLTAGHCYYGSDLETVAYIGSNDLSGNGTIVKIKRAVVHEGFKPPSLVNDITLLQLAESVELGPNVSPINLPSADLQLPQDSPVIAVGWGDTAFPSVGIPTILQYVSLGVVENSECSSRLQAEIVEGQVCVGGENGHGLCFGDSGSPLIWNNNTTVGIVSWGRPCGIGYPDVFTRVSSYIDWINSNINKLEALDEA